MSAIIARMAARARRPRTLDRFGVVLSLALLSGCPRATTSETESPEPDCPQPVVAEPAVFAPMVHGAYAGRVNVDSSALFVGKYYDFVGPVVRVRVRYLSVPEGTAETSRYSTCEAEVEVPVQWTERGFVVAQTVTVTSFRGDFERAELQPLADGSRQATHDKVLADCWVSVLEGEYLVPELSASTTKGRPNALRLIEPDGDEQVLEAVDPASESDFIQLADEYFWSQ